MRKMLSQTFSFCIMEVISLPTMRNLKHAHNSNKKNKVKLGAYSILCMVAVLISVSVAL